MKNIELANTYGVAGTSALKPQPMQFVVIDGTKGALPAKPEPPEDGGELDQLCKPPAGRSPAWPGADGRHHGGRRIDAPKPGSPRGSAPSGRFGEENAPSAQLPQSHPGPRGPEAGPGGQGR